MELRFFLGLGLFLISIHLSGQSAALVQAKERVNNYGRFDYGNYGKALAVEFKSLSFEELSDLMKNGKPIEKVYAFWGYAQKEGSDYRQFFEDLVKDTNKIAIKQGGCKYARPEEVGAFVFDIAENFRDRYGRFPTFPYFLDSVALEVEVYDNIQGNVNCRMMNYNAPEHLYEKLRSKALHGSVSALIGLSSYQNQRDIHLIKPHLNIEKYSWIYGVFCVERFPHPAFEEDILKLFNEVKDKDTKIQGGMFGPLCQLLYNYNNLEGKKALKEILSDVDQYSQHIVMLWCSFFRTKEYDHPLCQLLYKEVGKKQLKRVLKDFYSEQTWDYIKKEI